VKKSHHCVIGRAVHALTATGHPVSPDAKICRYFSDPDSTGTGAVGQAAEVRQKDNSWFESGQKTVQEKMARTPITGQAKNGIFSIAEGNGIGTNYATRLY